MSYTKTKLKQLESAPQGAIPITNSNGDMEFNLIGSDGQILTVVGGVPQWSTLNFPSEFETYDEVADFPSTGSTDVIYFALLENQFFIWNGVTYTQVPTSTSFSFTLSGNQGTSQNIGNGDTLSVLGTGVVKTTASNTDNLSIEVSPANLDGKVLTTRDNTTVWDNLTSDDVSGFTNDVQEIIDNYLDVGLTGTTVGSANEIPVLGYNSKGQITSVSKVITSYVPTSRTITVNGNTQDLTTNPSFTVSSASGICGISNGSGVYTYFTTLQDAFNSVTAGQTVEIFADIVTTTGNTISVSCNINFNGHTVTCTHPTQYALIFSTLNGELNLFNGKLLYTGGGSGSGGCLSTTNNGITVNSQGFYFCTNTTNVVSNVINLSATPNSINNAFCIASGNGSGINIPSTSCPVNAAVVIIRGNGHGIYNASVANNCVVNTNSTSVGSYYGIYGNYINNCTVIGTNSGTCIFTLASGETHNCHVLNTSSGTGIFPNNGSVIENTSVTVNTGKAVNTNYATIRNSVLKTYGGSNPAIELSATNSGCIIINSSIMSFGGAAIILNGTNSLSLNSSIISNNTIRSLFNDPTGHGIKCTFSSCTGLRIIDNTIIVTNASANGINSSGTLNTAKIVTNKFANSTLNVNANITAEPVTIDAYGNITI